MLRTLLRRFRLARAALREGDSGFNRELARLMKLDAKTREALVLAAMIAVADRCYAIAREIFGLSEDRARQLSTSIAEEFISILESREDRAHEGSTMYG